MENSIPASHLIPLGVIFAAIITGSLSWLNIVISKEDKTSEFRKEWANELRNDISKFIASISVLATSNKIIEEEIKKNPNMELVDKLGIFQTTFFDASNAYASILLRLASAEENESNNPQREELTDLLKSIIDEGRKKNYDKAKSLTNNIYDKATPLFQSEWKKIKEGEKTYQYSKLFLGTTIPVLIVTFFWFSFSAHNNLTTSGKNKSEKFCKENPTIIDNNKNQKVSLL